MKALPSQERLKSLLDYNPRTGGLIWKSRPREMFNSDRAANTWNSRYAGQPAFTAIDAKGYMVGSIDDTLYRASRIIFKWWHGTDALQVDHEDGNRQNNRIRNLRNVTSRQNQLNMKRPSNNTSGVMGVCWNSEKNAWDARVKVHGKMIFLGRSKSLEEATSLRKQAEKKYGFHKNHGR